MMSLIVAVVRKSPVLVDAGAPLAWAGDSTFGDEHAAATISAPPVTHSPQNAIGLMRSTPHADTRSAELQDGRIAELIAGRPDCSESWCTAKSRTAGRDLVRSNPA